MRATIWVGVAAAVGCGGEDGARAWQVAEVGVVAQPRKAWGLPWDVGSDPDLRITLAIDGQVVARCDGPDDSTIARCRMTARLDVDRPARIEVVVVDRDLRSDDRVGAARGALAAPPTGRTRVDLTPAGSLASAYAVIAPVPGPFAAHAGALIGLGVGVGAGLLVAIGLRGQLIRVVQLPAAPLGPDDVWDCAYCKAENRGAVLRCHACGAAR